MAEQLRDGYVYLKCLRKYSSQIHVSHDDRWSGKVMVQLFTQKIYQLLERVEDGFHQEFLGNMQTTLHS